MTYSVVAGSLFGDNPNPALDVPSSPDMEQGGVGDCYLIAALGAIADSSPAAIENMIIPNGVENGMASWTVRFYYQDPVRGYVADYVTVNAIMPGLRAGVSSTHSPARTAVGGCRSSRRRMPSGTRPAARAATARTPTRASMRGWMQAVDAQVLGSAATDYFPPGDPTAEQAVIAAIQSNEAVTAGIFLMGDPVRFNQLGWLPAMPTRSSDTTRSRETFQLENPWGFYEPAPLTWDDLCAYCGGLAVADALSTVPAATASVSSENLQATNATGAAHDAALQAVVAGRRYLPDAAWLADFAGDGNTHAMEAAQDAHARALELVLAESGR